MQAISESHRESLRSSLLVAEKRLREIKRTIENPTGRQGTIMYVELDDVDASAKRKILRLVGMMLNEVGMMQNDFNLEVSEYNSRSSILAALSEMWVVLEEMTPDKLKAYGKVSERERALIGPRVSKLLKQLDELESALELL